jgi:hypothetical protein
MTSQTRRTSSQHPTEQLGSGHQWNGGARPGWQDLLDYDETGNSNKDAPWDDADEGNSSEVLQQDLPPDLMDFRLSSPPKYVKLMQKRMMILLFKILYQTPDISILRSKLKEVKQLKITIVNIVACTSSTTVYKPADKNYMCPLTKNVYDNILEMLLNPILSHHEISVKAQFKDRDKTMLMLYYEVGNSVTFPHVDSPAGFKCQESIIDSLSLMELRFKVLSQSLVSRQINTGTVEFERLIKRMGFLPQMVQHIYHNPDLYNFYSKKDNMGRPESFQFRLLRAMIQNIFIFEKITCDTLIRLLPTYKRGMISPIPKLKAFNFLKGENATGSTVSSRTFRKVYSKLAEQFDKATKKNTLYHSFPLGEPLKFEDILIESEGELDFELENSIVMKQISKNPNILPEESLVLYLYQRRYQFLLNKLDHLQMSALFCFFPGNVSSFAAQAARDCLDLLAGEPYLRVAFSSILMILRVNGNLTQSDFEEMLALTVSAKQKPIPDPSAGIATSKSRINAE